MRTLRLTFTLALAGLALAACGRQVTPTPFILPTEVPPTETAVAVVPTEPVATLTPLPPTNTPTPVTPTATATPPTPPTATVPPTPDPNEGVGNVVFHD